MAKISKLKKFCKFAFSCGKTKTSFVLYVKSYLISQKSCINTVSVPALTTLVYKSLSSFHDQLADSVKSRIKFYRLIKIDSLCPRLQKWYHISSLQNFFDY